MTRFCFLLFLFIKSQIVQGQNYTSLNELNQPVAENTFKITTAKIRAIDRTLIEKDFPQLQNKNNQEIEQFIIDHAAYMAIPQITQQIVNSPIQYNQYDQTRAYRPDFYNRALVFETPFGPLLDVKGSGSVKPQPHNEFKSHRNGLLSLGDAIREYILQKKVQEILIHSQSEYETVEIYAIIDWGFDIIDRGRHTPAGAVVRQGHTRHPRASTYTPYSSRNHFLKPQDTKSIELLLRRYGITTTHWSTEVANKLLADVQGSNNRKRIVDFGTYRYFSPDEEINDVYWYPQRKDQQAKPIIGTAEAQLADNQPQKQLMLPKELWGYSASGGIRDAAFDNITIWSNELANNLARGIATNIDVEKHIQLFLNSKHYLANTELLDQQSSRKISFATLYCANLLD